MRVDLPVNNRAGKHEWQGVVGGGRPSAHLTASTGSGNITVGP